MQLSTRSSKASAGPGCRRAWALALLLAPIVAALVAAYPSGAPDQACKDLRPGHGAEPSASPSPFELSQDKLQAGAGDQIKGE